MSEQQSTESAPTAPTTTQGEVSVPAASPLERARAVLTERRAAAAAPPPEAAPPPQSTEPTEPNAADALLSGRPLAQKPEPIHGDDPNLARIVELDRQMRQEREQMNARALELDRYAKAAEAMKGGSKIAALEAMGLTYEEITAEIMKGPGGSLSPVTEELAEMRKKLEELPKSYEEKLAQMEQRQEAAERQAWESKTMAQIGSDAERWGLLNDPIAQHMLGSRSPSAAIYETMERHWQETGGGQGGEVLTEEQAADMLEAALDRQVRQRAATQPTKLHRLLGLSAPPGPSPTPAPTAVNGARRDVPPAPPLSIEAASVSTAGEPPTGTLTASDYKRRALEIAKQRGLAG